MPAPFMDLRGGVLHVNFSPAQSQAMRSEKRTVAIIAGSQSGKTVVGPHWLMQEIRRRGPGDYMVVSPTFTLLSKKALPEFLKLFERMLALGTYHKADKIFLLSDEGQRRIWARSFSEPTQIFFGYAEDPESLESATAKAAWLDEAGQSKFKLGSYQAIMRRLAIHTGRLLITTTPYDLGWLTQKIYNPWRKGTDPTIDVVRFESRENPAFPIAEWDRAKRDLPRWKFDMMYRGIPTRPSGVIYDAFDSESQTCPRFTIPLNWDRFLGVDFGGVNTAALFYARDPNRGYLYLYREYKAGGRTASDHATYILEGEVRPRDAWGGSQSEGQWRNEFAKGGLPLKPPVVKDVEVGIDRVYGFHSRDELIVFDDLEGYLEEKATYRRALDKLDQPTQKIEDKDTFHFMDAERYVLSGLAPTAESIPSMDFSQVVDSKDMDHAAAWRIE